MPQYEEHNRPSREDKVEDVNTPLSEGLYKKLSAHYMQKLERAKYLMCLLLIFGMIAGAAWVCLLQREVCREIAQVMVTKDSYTPLAGCRWDLPQSQNLEDNIEFNQVPEAQ